MGIFIADPTFGDIQCIEIDIDSQYYIRLIHSFLWDTGICSVSVHLQY